MRSPVTLVALVLLAPATALAADLVAVDQVTPAPGLPIRPLDHVEVRVQLDRSYADPFDPEVISVTAVLENGLDEHFFTGFWFQDFEIQSSDGVERLVEVGEPGFLIRLRALDEGTWRLWVRASDDDGEDALDIPLELVVVGSPTAPGFLRRLPESPRGLQWSSGERYVPFGANVCWANDLADFTRYFDALAENGLTWTRVWMTHFDATALEWSSGDDGAYQGLGRFNLKAAWRVDRILQLAEERGIALQLVLQQHSQFETSNWSSWDGNPWNQVNGGPLATSGQFFTDPDVIAGFDRKLVYVAARYAASSGLLAWELFNEVELIDGAKKADFEAWSRERAERLKVADPYRHPVTTSYSSACWAGCTQPWSDGAYDLAQVHSYLPDYWLSLRKAAAHMLTVGKPVIVGELGIDFLGEKNKADAAGTHLLNTTLLAALLGFEGGSMSWWWDNWLEPNGLWSVLGNAAKALRAVRIEQWAHPVEARVTANVPLEVVAAGGFGGAGGLAGTGLVVWLHDPTSEWDGPTAAEAFAEIVVDCLDLPAFASDFCDPPTATFVDPRTGLVVAADPSGYLGLPRFRRDLLVTFDCPPPPCGATLPETAELPPDGTMPDTTGDEPAADQATEQDLAQGTDAVGPEEPDDAGGTGSGGCAVTSFR